MFNNIKDTRIGKFTTTCLKKIKGFWPWYKGLYKGRKWYTKTGVAILSAIIAFFVYLFMVDINFYGCLVNPPDSLR